MIWLPIKSNSIDSSKKRGLRRRGSSKKNGRSERKQELIYFTRYMTTGRERLRITNLSVRNNCVSSSRIKLKLKNASKLMKGKSSRKSNKSLRRIEESNKDC
jgi:hypothetical protein